MDVFSYKLGQKSAGGGADLSEYFEDTISNGASYSSVLKKIPSVTFTGSSAYMMFDRYPGDGVDLSGFSESRISNGSRMFNAASNIKTLDFSNINLSSLTNGTSMFAWMSKLEEITFSNNGPTSNNFNAEAMFYYDSKIKILDLSSFNITMTTTAACNSMFRECSTLEKLDIRGITFPNLSSSTNTFSSVPANCLIIVKDDTEKNKVLAERSDFTNVKTVAEYEG